MGSGLARPWSEWRHGRQPPARRRSPRGRAERGHHRAPATSEAAQHTRATRARPPPRTTRSGAAHRRGCAATRAHLDLRRAPKQYLKHRCAGTGLTSGVAGPAPSCAPPPPLHRRRRHRLRNNQQLRWYADRLSAASCGSIGGDGLLLHSMRLLLQELHTELILCSWAPWTRMAACWTSFLPFCDEQ